MKKTGVALIAVLVSTFSHAEVDSKNLYFGAGLGLNSLSGIDLNDGLGLQFFAGYKLPVDMGDGKLSVEAGYMDTGDMDVRRNIPGQTPGTFIGETKANGLWVNAVVDFPLKNELSFVARAGLDLGDDDGLMIGAGLGFQLNEKMDIRTEYVIRDHVDSLQVNLVIRQ